MSGADPSLLLLLLLVLASRLLKSSMRPLVGDSPANGPLLAA